MKAVFDTNILIDYLNGRSEAKQELALYDERLISIISYIEVLVGAVDDDEATVIRNFLSSFHLIDVTRPIAELAVQLQQQHSLKVPDAIVYATARNAGCMLVTRNTKDMKKDWPDVRAPYR